MTNPMIDDLIKDIREQIKIYYWYPEDKEKQRNALKRLEFCANTAVLEMDGFFELYDEVLDDSHSDT